MAAINDPISLAILDDDLEMIVGTGGALMRWTSGVEAVAQNIESAIKLAVGECRYNLELGTPYDDFMGERYNEKRIHAIFRDRLLSVANVEEIVSLNTTFDGITRTLAVVWSVRTSFSDAPIEGETVA